MEPNKGKALLEAVLFLSGDPVVPASLKAVMGADEGSIRRLFDELVADYHERKSGVVITEVAGGYQMVTSPLYAEEIRKYAGLNVSSKLSIAALETLSIIAYQQPIIKAEVEQIRGVGSEGVMKTLLDKRLIKIIGKKEVPGKPLLYGTTREFLQYFGLKDLTDLPTLKDFAREDAA